MMPPLAPTFTSNSAVDSSTMVDQHPIASEAEADADDLIDVVGVHAAGLYASGPFGRSGAGGKKYHCQRCLNHGLEIPRKGHKRECRYMDCQCEDCKLVEKRKILNREINNERERVSNSPVTVVADSNEDEKNDAIPVKVRNPRCARCRAHDPDKEPPPLKGHKKACRYKSCECKKCTLITSRRDVMARQIRLRRKQKSKNHSGSVDSSVSSTQRDTSNGSGACPTGPMTDGAASEEDGSKMYVDLATSPSTPAQSPDTATITMTNSSSDGNLPPAAPIVQPQQESVTQAGVVQIQDIRSVDFCPTAFTSANPVHVPVFQFVGESSQQPTAPCGDMSSGNVCPHSILAGLLQYAQAMAASSVTSCRSGMGAGGLTLPILPANTIDQGGLVGEAAGFSPTVIAAALQVTHGQRPSMADVCAIPYFFAPTAGPSFLSVPQAAQFCQPVTHQPHCLLNGHHAHHQIWGTTGPFGQCPPMSQTHSRLFTL